MSAQLIFYSSDASSSDNEKLASTRVSSSAASAIGGLPAPRDSKAKRDKKDCVIS
jgi:hypothetical protein